jgi:hypothetical protein
MIGALIGGILIGGIIAWAIASWRHATTIAPPLEQSFHCVAVGWRPIAPAQHFPNSEPLTIGPSLFEIR